MRSTAKTQNGARACTVGIVVPLLDESANLDSLIRHLASCDADQVIIVDGGSSDGSWEALCSRRVDNRWCVIQSPRGRARQMNAGIARCRCDVVLFVHADTRLPRDAIGAIRRAILVGGRSWGRFNVSFDSGSLAMVIVAWFMNRRSCVTGICTGDQAIFVTRTDLASVGGIPDMALMEDVELSRRLKRLCRPCCLSLVVTTSDRRWRRDGVARTVCRMWWMRLRYWLGARPDSLAEGYRHVR
jgi:rSAM/selenodomain-associated transferase 2